MIQSTFWENWKSSNLEHYECENGWHLQAIYEQWPACSMLTDTWNLFITYNEIRNTDIKKHW